ncbi:hypothetical protein GALL_541180 [mine drainage metagenome]|uniref:Zinc-ribbon domain-containing protein n=1 Tax=mine drainage metagenome TaxID=410659 RepID=A0A1J5PGF0_9ZZZZ
MPPSNLSIVRCDACFKEIENDNVFCANCGYPLRGTKAEQVAFIKNQNQADFDADELKNRINKRIKKAGNTLFWLAGVFFLCAAIAFFVLKDNPEVLAVVIPYIVLGVVFLLLGDYSKKKTLACLISGLCLYIIVQAIDLVQNPHFNLFSFIIIAIIITFLTLGVKSAFEIEKIKKENNIS